MVYATSALLLATIALNTGSYAAPLGARELGAESQIKGIAARQIPQSRAYLLGRALALNSMSNSAELSDNGQLSTLIPGLSSPTGSGTPGNTNSALLGSNSGTSGLPTSTGTTGPSSAYSHGAVSSPWPWVIAGGTDNAESLLDPYSASNTPDVGAALGSFSSLTGGNSRPSSISGSSDDDLSNPGPSPSAASFSSSGGAPSTGNLGAGSLPSSPSSLTSSTPGSASAASTDPTIVFGSSDSSSGVGSGLGASASGMATGTNMGSGDGPLDICGILSAMGSSNSAESASPLIASLGSTSSGGGSAAGIPAAGPGSADSLSIGGGGEGGPTGTSAGSAGTADPVSSSSVGGSAISGSSIDSGCPMSNISGNALVNALGGNSTTAGPGSQSLNSTIIVGGSNASSTATSANIPGSAALNAGSGVCGNSTTADSDSQSLNSTSTTGGSTLPSSATSPNSTTADAPPLSPDVGASPAEASPATPNGDAYSSLQQRKARRYDIIAKQRLTSRRGRVPQIMSS